MTADIALHNATEEQLRHFAARPSHALALIGPNGSGKTAVAIWLVGQLSGLSSEALHNSPQFRLIAPTGLSISIEDIRSLAQFTKLKTAGQGLRRFVVVEHAEALTPEAQNAFLKLLEEPPADTLIILTLPSQQAVLPTIISRTQRIVIRRPAREQLQPLLNMDDAQFEQLYLLSGGLPGLLAAMKEQASDHPLLPAVATAKDLLVATKFERLVIVDELARQKADHLLVLEALERIADSSLAAAASQNNIAGVTRWQGILATAYATRLALRRGAQPKLALADLALAL